MHRYEVDTDVNNQSRVDELNPIVLPFVTGERSRDLNNLLNLTDKEAQLLGSLARAGKGGIGREALMKDVWGFAGDMDTHTLETHIYRLREKFRELGGGEGIVVTDGGYRLETK